MAASTSYNSSARTSTPISSIVNFGRGGYNKDDDEEDERTSTFAPLTNNGRGGYNKGGDDDDEAEDGRGGYN